MDLQKQGSQETEVTTQERDEQEQTHCYYCYGVHPYGYHAKSRIELGNNYGNTNQKTYMQAASTCRRCKAEIRDQEICGACGQIGKSGERLHCYDHCLEFIRASPEERLKQVQKHGDCTICLIKGHDTEAHLARAAGKPDRIQTCSLYDKHTNSSCTSTQNASFLGASTHKQYTHKGFHAKAFPVDTMARDTGKPRTKEAWVKAAKITRAEEMKEAIRLLNEPDLDGDQILLLVQAATVVMDEKRVQKKTSSPPNEDRDARQPGNICLTVVISANLGGRHEKIFPEPAFLSQACHMLRRSAAPVAQRSFKIKQMDNLFQLGDTMGDYIPKSCSNCKKCSMCTFAGGSITQ